MSKTSVAKLWKPVTACLLAMILILAGCSKPAEPKNSAAPSNSSSGSTEPIKIGVILSFSGNFAPLSESIKEGLELYFAQQNNQIKGRPVTIKYEDDEANPQVALRKYRQLVDGEKVDMLLGPISSAVIAALRDPIEKDKIVLIDANAASNEVSWDKKSDYIYRTSFSNYQNGIAGTEYIAKNVGKTAVVIAPDYPAGKEVVESFKAGFEKAGGKVVKELWPKLNNNDYAAYITQISETKPDLVYAFLAGTDGIRFVQQYEQFGLKGKIPLTGSLELGDPIVTDPAAGAAEGIMAAVNYTSSLDNEKNKKFVADFQKKYNKLPNVFNVSGYDSGALISQAVEKAGSSKSADLIKVIKGMKVDSPRGPLIMDEKTNNFTQNFYIVKAVKKDGKITQQVLETVNNVAIPEKQPGK